MKRRFWLVWAAALWLTGPASGQSTINLTKGSPASVAYIGATSINPPSGVTLQTLYYWVIARYPAGRAIATGPAQVINATPTASLSVTRFVTVSWNGVTGATGYDVVRNTGPTYPEPCAACAVVLNTAATTVNDTGGALAAYPPVGVPIAGAATANLTLDNQNAANPYIAVQLTSSGASRLGLLSGAFAVGDCPQYSADGTLASAGACAAGMLTASGPPANHQIGVFTGPTNLKGYTLADKMLLAGVTGADPAGKSLSDLSPTEYVVGGGTAQAQTAVLVPAATALTAGLTVRWLPLAANTGPGATLAVDALTATLLTRCGTVGLTAGDLSTLAVAVATYDGTEFQLQNPQATPCGNIPSGSGGGPGVGFFLDDTNIVPISANNVNQVNTLTKTPVTATSVVTDSLSAASNTVQGEAYLYNTALGITAIPGGVWTFNLYGAVNTAVGGRVSTLTMNGYVVQPYSANITTSGSGTSRTATAASGTPFATSKIVASANARLASFLQTPQGLYQITARADDVTVTIATPAGYADENPATSYSVWLSVASGTTSTITNIAPAYTLYSVGVAAPSLTVATTAKLGSIAFATSNNTTTVSYQHNGTSTYSNFTTPIAIIHNDLTGLQGGTANEYYHLTSAEYTGTGTGTPMRNTSPAIATDIHAATPGAGTLGTNAAPFAGLFVGGAATNNIHVTGTSAGAAAANIPDPGGVTGIFPMFAAAPAGTKCLHTNGTTGLITEAAGDCGVSGGTVSVVGAGSLAATALVTGGGTTELQTPAPTATMDASGNISTPGMVTSGVGGSAAGADALGAGTAPVFGAGAGQIPTAGVFGWFAPATMTSTLMLYPPNADPAANQIMLFGAASGNKATFAWKTVADANTVSAIVARDGSGDFAAGTIRPASLLATGIVDGTAPVIVTTGTTGTPGATYNNSYSFNQHATAATAVTYTLPTAAEGKQYCVGNSYNGSAPNTGVLTIQTSAAGQYIIFTDGTLSASGGYVSSGGAAGDFACVIGVDTTHWYLRPGEGIWSKH